VTRYHGSESISDYAELNVRAKDGTKVYSNGRERGGGSQRPERKDVTPKKGGKKGTYILEQFIPEIDIIFRERRIKANLQYDSRKGRIP